MIDMPVVMAALAGFINGVLQPFAKILVDIVLVVLAIQLLNDLLQPGKQPLRGDLADYRPRVVAA